MRIDPIADFEIDTLGYRFVDFHNIEQNEDRRDALEIMRSILQGILDSERPGVTICQSASSQIDGCDPELGVANFVAYRGDEIRGCFNIYNVRQSPESFSAMAAPGLLAADGLTVEQTWAAAMRWMLEHLVDRWEFPAIPGQAWKDDLRADAVVSELIDGGHAATLREDGSPEFVDRVLSAG